MRILLAIAIALATAGHSWAETKIRRDVAYSDKKFDRARQLDIYTIDEANDRPVIIWIHGGGWKKGDKAGVQRKPAFFLRNGFVFVSVNYRFAPEVTVNTMAGDVAKAIRWVRDNAKRIGGSPDSLYVLGHSAGAHLAALVCTDPRYLKAESMALSDIRGCAPVDTAAYDIPKQVASVRPARRATYTSVFGENASHQKALSPAAHAAKDRGIPPFLILHVASRADSTAQSKAFAQALRKAGVQADVFAAKGKNHGTINREIGLPDDPPTKALLAFLKKTEESSD